MHFTADTRGEEFQKKMGRGDEEVFHRRLYEAGKQLEHASSNRIGLLETITSNASVTTQCNAPITEYTRTATPSEAPGHRCEAPGHRCVTQITKITAPNEPYEDEVMKEIFTL